MTKDLHYYLLSAFVIAAAIWANNAKAETYLYAGAWSKHFMEGE